MATAKVKYIRRGKKTPAIYIQIMNGNVYRFNRVVDGTPRVKLVEAMKDAERVNLNDFTLVKPAGAL